MSECTELDIRRPVVLTEPSFWPAVNASALKAFFEPLLRHTSACSLAPTSRPAVRCLPLPLNIARLSWFPVCLMLGSTRRPVTSPATSWWTSEACLETSQWPLAWPGARLSASSRR